MKIELEDLGSMGACMEGILWFTGQRETEVKKIVELLIAEKRLEWADWLVVNCLSRTDIIRQACFSARQVLPIFEKSYPEDLWPRAALDEIEKGLQGYEIAKVIELEEKTIAAAAKAAEDRNVAANSAAWSVIHTAETVVAALVSKRFSRQVWTLLRVFHGTLSAINSAAKAASSDERDELKIKIIRNGLSLLEPYQKRFRWMIISRRPYSIVAVDEHGNVVVEAGTTCNPAAFDQVVSRAEQLGEIDWEHSDYEDPSKNLEE